MTSEALDKAGQGTLDIGKPGPMMLAVLGKGEFPAVDNSAVRLRIVSQILNATTPEEIVNAGKAEGLEQYLGRPLEVHDAVARPSTIEGDGMAGFLVMDCVTLDDGERAIITTGAENVVLRVAAAADRGLLPIRFKVRRSGRPTEAGYFPFIVESV